jgi:hypothetical protein
MLTLFPARVPFGALVQQRNCQESIRNCGVLSRRLRGFGAAESLSTYVSPAETHRGHGPSVSNSPGPTIKQPTATLSMES